MHVCLDYRPALHEGTGVGTYVRGLLRGLLSGGGEDRFTAFSASLRHRLTLESEFRGARLVDARFPVRLLDWLWHRQGWPPVEAWTGAVDIAHSPSPLPIPCRARQVVTVHDCYFLRHPEHVDGTVRRDYVPLVRRAVARADAVMTVSETTRDELCELLVVHADRVHVAHLGVDDLFTPPAADLVAATRARFDLHGPYLLFVGRREPRKDLATLLRTFAIVRARHPGLQLVLTGPDGFGWQPILDAAAPATRRAVHCLPHQNAMALVGLYGGAETLLLSSRWEGFGLTALEAMATGTPVVATRAGSLPEILGNAALWAPIGDAEGLAAACSQVLEDTETRDRHIREGLARAAGFTWARTAAITRAVYRGLLS